VQTRFSVDTDLLAELPFYAVRNFEALTRGAVGRDRTASIQTQWLHSATNSSAKAAFISDAQQRFELTDESIVIAISSQAVMDSLRAAPQRQVKNEDTGIPIGSDNAGAATQLIRKHPPTQKLRESMRLNGHWLIIEIFPDQNSRILFLGKIY
jgi:hypothetical protein